MNTDTQTKEQAQKELIAKLKLRYDFRGSAYTWGRTSNEFHIYFDIFVQPFSFYGSVNDYENNVKELSDSDLLNAYRCIISDAFCIYEAPTLNDFLEMFGYIDSEDIGTHPQQLKYILSPIEYESGVTAYKGCRELYNRINKSYDDMGDILDNLSSIGIE